MPYGQSKRKRFSESTKSSGSNRPLKTETRSLDNLPWRSVKGVQDADIGGENMFELEEVEDVEVTYEESAAGRVAKFRVIKDQGPRVGKNDLFDKPEVQVMDEITENDSDERESFDCAELLPQWQSHSLHPRLLRSLLARKFISPTPIQAQAIPFALAGRDVVGVAETGSGKTLAYGLPLLHYLLSLPRPSSTRRRLRALILAPTRELALQVSTHLNDCLKTDEPATSVSEKPDKNNEENPAGSVQVPKKPPLVSIAAIVGGMSSQKQRRVLDRGVDVLVATPGRLWEILEDDDRLAGEMKCLKFLVLDEADRMVETGHFAELDNIIRLTLRNTSADDATIEKRPPASNTDSLQTFVFSATLSKDLQRNLRKRSQKKSYKHKRTKTPATTLDELVLRLDFRDPHPEVIDLSPEGGLVSTLKESKIECLSADKDVYLYYFLIRYPGRSLVFLAAIDGIRRLFPLLELLGIKAWALHSQMEQRQRLKNLDRFKANPNSVLLATDIAARGLDIPAVDHVIHYQIPRSADSYVHRTGRTARAMRKGFSMLMCAPDERKVVRGLLSSLGRGDTEIPEMPIELFMIDKLKARVRLARQIDLLQHKIQKEKHERHWMTETAEALELEIDSDFVSESETGKPRKQQRTKKSAAATTMKAELRRLLAQPLIAPGISSRYITSGTNPIVDDLIAGEFNQGLIGLKRTEADRQLSSQTPTKKRKIYEEWNGIA